MRGLGLFLILHAILANCPGARHLCDNAFFFYGLAQRPYGFLYFFRPRPGIRSRGFKIFPIYPAQRFAFSKCKLQDLPLFLYLPSKCLVPFRLTLATMSSRLVTIVYPFSSTPFYSVPCSCLKLFQLFPPVCFACHI